jgi:DNA-binding response OmpR family regulator
MVKSSKISVLIVEDEHDILTLYGDVLRKEGFDVLTATDGGQGMKQALERNPDVILLDILMPGVDGITMLREIRAKGCESKVVILTASPTLRLNEGVELGIHAYLNKAVSTPRDIAQLIRQTVR